MKFGYGHNRSPRNFAPYGCERLFLDDSTTRRQERVDLMSALSNAQIPDTLILLQRGDLGSGQEIPKLMEDLAAMNVTVEIKQALATPKRPVGRPKTFDPTPEQSGKLERLWRTSLPLSHVLVRAREVMGFEVKRHQMIYRFGPRWKKPTDAPLEGADE